MPRAIATPVVLLLVLSVLTVWTTAPMRAQGAEGVQIAQGANPTATLLAYINEHGDAVVVSGDLTMRYHTRALSTDGCSLTLDELTQSEVDDMHNMTQLDLRTLTPDVQVANVDVLSDVYAVRVETTSGESANLTHRTTIYHTGENKGKEQQNEVHGSFTEIVFPSKVSAERAKELARNAIQHCGGAVRPAEVTAELKSAEEEKNALMDRLRKQCQRLVLGKLKSPGSAKFDVESPGLSLRKKDGGIYISGEVDAEIGYGASLRKNYICTFRLEGESWLPDGDPLVF
jgi:hypothetical protein